MKMGKVKKNEGRKLKHSLRLLPGGSQGLLLGMEAVVLAHTVE